MISKNMICILFISLMLASALGCLAQNSEGPSVLTASVPRENLPEGFTLLAALPEMDSRVNMTDYIEDFYGDLDIGPANASVGIYQWGRPTGPYDAKITLIQLSGDEKANNAVSNFRAQYDDLAARGLPVYGNATISGHEALEIKDLLGDNSIRYLYLWSREALVVLVEGNEDRNQSLELAEAAGV